MSSFNPFTRLGVYRIVADELEPPADRIRLAEERYRSLGNWISDYGGAVVSRNVHVYPQGSYRLGTTNQDPLTGEFDIDLVISVAFAKREISQKELNQHVNGWLGSYVAEMHRRGGLLAPIGLEKGRRAWTLAYDDQFHMDVLPVVPDLESEIWALGGIPSWLTDKTLYRWQPTNPQGFGVYFDEVSGAGAIRLEKRRVDVEPLPDYGEFKTPLQRAAQLVKRHRDVYPTENRDNAPPSALITAAMTKAYEKYGLTGEPLDVTIAGVVASMHEFIEVAGGELVISNPTCPDENYADRYSGDHTRKAELWRWLGIVQADLAGIEKSVGLPNIAESVDRAFGRGLGERFATRAKDLTNTARSAGALSTTAAGTLTIGTGAARTNHPHEFYGT